MGTNTTQDPAAEDVQILEKTFRTAGFADVEAYRFSFASLRLRIRDNRFRGLSRVARMRLVEPVIDQLPQEIQEELIFVLPIAPGEETSTIFRRMNDEFERREIHPD